MAIPNNDYTLKNRQLLPELEAAFREVALGGQTDVVPQVKELEQQVAAILGGGHCIAVQSGTAALFLALKGLGIGPGDEVVTVPNSDISTTAAVSHTGARFVLCDVDPVTFNLDPQKLEACITPRTKAIIPVHLYGHPADIDPILAVADRHGIPVVEDATLALGARYKGRPAGRLGTCACFSFTASKVIGALGNGGMVVVRDDPALAERIRLIKGYGMHPSRQEASPYERGRYGYLDHLAEGYNLRMDSVQAAIMRVKLRYLEPWAAERRWAAARYARHFAGTPVQAPVERPDCVHAWRNYAVLVPRRDAVRQALMEQGIGTSMLYAPPVHLQPVYRHLGLGRGSLPVSEDLGEKLLCLPMFPGITAEQVDAVAAALLKEVRA